MDTLIDAIEALAALVSVVTPWLQRQGVGTRREHGRVPDDDRRPYTPPRAVDVEHDDGTWYPGWQDAWVRWPDGSWRASVSYTIAPGTKYLRSVPAEKVRLPDR
jgi:hypothetical protein